MRLRWPREPVIGPLGAWELVRIARRAQGHRARLIVLYLVLAAAVFTPVIWFFGVPVVELFVGTKQHVGINEAGTFANRFALAYLEATLLAVVAMTPAYAAVSLAEEKEQGSLILLLTTLLTDREIILGKAAARYGQVLAAALAALPLLVSTILFGGVSALFILNGCVVVATTAAVAVAAGLLAAVVASDVRGALIRAYGLTAIIVLVAPPFVVLLILEHLASTAGMGWPLWLVVNGFAMLQLVIAAGLLLLAGRQLRGTEPPGSVRPPRPADQAPTVEKLRLYAAERDLPAVAPLDLPELPPVGETDALLWKERHVVGRRAWAEATFVSFAVRIAFRLAAIGLVHLGTMRAVSDAKGETLDFISVERDSGADLLLAGGTLAIALYLTPAAAGLAAAIARERRQATLEALLALPMERRAMLVAKVRAALERGWWLPPLAAFALGAAFGIERDAVQGLGAAAYVGASIVLVTGVGSWLSVRCWTEQQSLRLLVPVVAVAIALPAAVWLTTADTPVLVTVFLFAAAVVAALIGAFAWAGACRGLHRIGLTRG